MTVSYLKRVQAGAEWLDQVKPGWVLGLDLSKLNIENPHQCILAQLFGSFAKGDEAVMAAGHESYQFGFDVADDEDDKAFDWLAKRWRAQIEQRQQAIAAEVVG